MSKPKCKITIGQRGGIVPSLKVDNNPCGGGEWIPPTFFRSSFKANLCHACQKLTDFGTLSKITQSIYNRETGTTAKTTTWYCFPCLYDLKDGYE